MQQKDISNKRAQICVYLSLIATKYMKDLDLSILRELNYNNQQISSLLEKYKIEVDIELRSIFIIIPAMDFEQIVQKLEKIRGLSSYYGTPKFSQLLEEEKNNIKLQPLKSARKIKDHWEVLKKEIINFQYLCTIENFVDKQIKSNK